MGWDQVEIFCPDDLALGIAGCPQCIWIGIDEATRQVRTINDVMSALHNGTITLLALAQRFFRRFLPRDIPIDAVDPNAAVSYHNGSANHGHAN